MASQQLLTWREALAIASTDAIASRVRRGVWQSPLPNVYAPHANELSAEDWGLAAVLATGGRPIRSRARSVASGRTAARAWRFPLIDDDDPATGAHEAHLHEVITNRGLRTLSRPGDLAQVRRRQVALEPHEVVFHTGGFWLTTPLRTVVDCASSLPFEAAVCLMDDGLRRGLFTPSELSAQVVQRSGRVGCRRLAAAVAAADGRAESPAESLARLILLPALPGLVPQVVIRDGDRFVARVDLGDEQIRLAVEVDGKAWHSGEQMVAKDRARDRRLEHLGWWTERCTWHELRCQQDDLVERLLWRDSQLRSRAA